MLIRLKDMHVGDIGRVVEFDKSFLPYRQKMFIALGFRFWGIREQTNTSENLS